MFIYGDLTSYALARYGTESHLIRLAVDSVLSGVGRNKKPSGPDAKLAPKSARDTNGYSNWYRLNTFKCRLTCDALIGMGHALENSHS